MDRMTGFCSAFDRPLLIQILPSVDTDRKHRPPLAKSFRLHALPVGRNARPERVVPNAETKQVAETVWSNNAYRSIAVQVHADTGGKFRPSRNALFEGDERWHDLPEFRGEPLMHESLIRNLPMQFGHGRAKAAFEMGIPLRLVNPGVEVNDIHVFDRRSSFEAMQVVPYQRPNGPRADTPRVKTKRADSPQRGHQPVRRFHHRNKPLREVGFRVWVHA